MLTTPLPTFGFLTTAAICTIAALSVACTPRQATVREFDDTFEVQARINEYFHLDVLPKLENCWGLLNGEGTVTIAYVYEISPERTWKPKQMDVHESTLSKEQNQAALSCMRKAVAGSSFPLGPNDALAEEHLLFWTWPVPLPDDEVVLKQDDGCDGHGTPAICKECTWTSSGVAKCINVCVGWSKCKASGNSCTITLRRCASGGAFGFSSFGGGIFAP